MKRFLHFFSLAVMTQVILMLSQLILLPIQVRLWGQTETAAWYAALALATMTYVVDCGLRTAGHAELVKASSGGQNHLSEASYFRQIWSWIRVLILVVTAVLTLSDFAVIWILHPGSYAFWRPALILACSLESLLVIRITYLDSLGRYRGAEASYLCFAVLRLILSIPALLLFHWKAPGLAVIYLLTSVFAMAAQEYWLCSSIPLLQLWQRFPVLSWRLLAISRLTVAEPLANWMRLSLPVLVIGQIAPSMAVTTYVALRAVFGAGRTTIQQLARVASVECLNTRRRGEVQRAESLLTVFVMAAIFFGSCAGFAVVVDNMRILGLWLKHFNRLTFQDIALAFSLTAPFFSYQIPMNLKFRTGELAWVARRHYGFVAYSLLFAGVSLLANSLPVYLGLLVLAESMLSTTFFTGSKSGGGAMRMAALSFGIICAFWMMARADFAGVFSGVGFVPILSSAVLLVCSILALGSVQYRLYRKDVSVLRERPVAIVNLDVA